jgi:hypothetical protein
MLRFRPIALALVLAAAPALAAQPTGPELARWLAANTDIPASQVAIAGPELVYSLEPLGPRTSTGEVLALVRTEPLAADWAASHGFQSWEAHLLIDCFRGRLRQIRSATYPERNRKGPPTAEAAPVDWTTPETTQPATQLVAAACDPAFAWPLRHNNLLTATPRPLPPPLVVAKPTAPAPPVPAPTAAAAKPGPYAVQLGRGPSEAGAKKALADARQALGPLAETLTATTEITEISRGRRRYAARLTGFATAAAAAQACDTLVKAGQDCLTRNPAR